MIVILGVVVAVGAALRGNWSPCGESLQAQLHPLGERGRGNKWSVTILFFTIGSVVAGAGLGGLFGLIGLTTGSGSRSNILLGAALAMMAGILDLSPLRPPTPKRQVNENWINRYRGWVYGAAFGVQLGLGFAVFVMSWGYYAMLLIAFLSGSPWIGVGIGALFGATRGLLLYLSRGINTPESLRSFHLTMAAWREPVFRVTGAATLTIGAVALLRLI